jgi:hypothetical protein
MLNLKIIIAGSRDITDYQVLLEAITKAVASGVITPAHSFEIISGGARGVDTLARKYATEERHTLIEMKPQYIGKNDKGAPLRRNIEMANYGDVLIAVWNGSPGTKHIIDYTRKIGKPVYIHDLR